MIYTITTNPAIDYHMDLNELSVGHINRSLKEEMYPGGKGLNVSVVLSQLGVSSRAWGFAAGKVGRMLEDLANDFGCDCDFIYLPKGETRINVKLDCEQETAVNGNGPMIESEQVDQLLGRVRALSGADTLILSGKLQAGGLYEKICELCHERGVRLIVDTEGEDLRRTFAWHPFLIKPNEEELLALYGSTDANAIVSLMKRCQEDGAENIFVTLGGEGALFLSEEGILYQCEITGEHNVISTVGAGDSAIAGFLAGLSRYPGGYEDALRLACAAGTATACQKWLCRGDEAEKLMKDIKVKMLTL